jgi:hypothetical protein
MDLDIHVHNSFRRNEDAAGCVAGQPAASSEGMRHTLMVSVNGWLQTSRNAKFLVQ